MAPLFELFYWNAINVHELAFSYARFTLCGDTLTTAHGLHAVRSALVCEVHVSSCLHITVMLWPQNLHIHIPQDFWGNNNLSNGAVPDPSSL